MRKPAARSVAKLFYVITKKTELLRLRKISLSHHASCATLG